MPFQSNFKHNFQIFASKPTSHLRFDLSLEIKGYLTSDCWYTLYSSQINKDKQIKMLDLQKMNPYDHAP